MAVGIISSSPVRQRYRISTRQWSDFETRSITRRRVARSRICQSMPKRSAIAANPVCSADNSTARSAAVKNDPHEEMTGLDVVELLGVENVLPVMSKERGDGRYDA